MKSKEDLTKELQGLKSKYGKVYTFIIPLNAEDVDKDEDIIYATIYARKPDRMVFASVSKLVTGSDPLRANEAFLKSTYVGGDDLNLIMTNDEALRSIDSAMVEILNVKQATLKKN